MMNSVELENIEKWLEPSEGGQVDEVNEYSPRQGPTDDEKKLDDFDPNFSWIKTLNIKAQNTSNVHDSFMALQHLLSPTFRKGSQPNLDRDRMNSEVNEDKALMQLSRIAGALTYTRNGKIKLSSRIGGEDSNIHEEVDKILKDLDISLDQVLNASSDNSEEEEADPKSLEKFLGDDIFNETKDLSPVSPQKNRNQIQSEPAIQIKDESQPSNVYEPTRRVNSYENASKSEEVPEREVRSANFETKSEVVPAVVLTEKAANNLSDADRDLQKAVKKVIKMQKHQKNKCEIF